MPARRIRIPGVVAALAFSLACATSKEGGALPTYQETRTETATAVVQAIDLQSREVTLRGQDGKPFSFVAGPEVRNLPQVQVGDTVKVTYTESLAVEVKRADSSAPAVSTAASATRAAPGQMPGGQVTGVVTGSAEIIAIDRETSRVTLRGAEGKIRILQVRDPKKLENVQVGDTVYATYTESVGVAVERIPATPAK